MAYKKTNWQDTLRDAKGNVIQKGTPLNAQALGKIEDGIVQAEQKIDNEISQVTTQLAQNVEKINAIEINVVDYGAVADFNVNSKTGTNNFIAFKEAVNVANVRQVPLKIPSGNFLVSTNETIDITTDIICEGAIYTPSSINSAIFNIKRTTQQKNVTLTSLSQLVKNSTVVTDLSQYVNHDIILKSSEILIKRNGGGTFTKNDITRVTDTTGKLLSLLDCTYTDLTKLTVTAREKERKIQVSGLRIFAYNDGSANVAKYALRVERSDVELINCNIASSDNAVFEIAVIIIDSLNHNFNNCIITDCRFSQGYGISLTNTSHTNIYNSQLTNCRHGLSGRHMKKVTIDNSTTDTDFDTHWGNDFNVINSVTKSVIFAGTDLTVSNSTFLDTPMAINLRDGEPEFFGTLTLENIKIKSANTTFTLIGFGNANNSYDYERKLSNFELIKVDNVTLDTPNINFVYMFLSGTRGYLHDVVGRFDIKHVISVQNKPLFFAMTKDYTKIPNKKDTVLVFEGINFGGTNSTTASTPIAISDLNTVANSVGFDILFRNCRGVAFRIDASLIKRLAAENSDIVFVRKRGDGRAPLGRMYFYGCSFYNTYFWTENNYVFLNCLFDGTITNLSALKIDYAIGCFSTTVTTGANYTNGLAQNGFITNNPTTT